jgi:repressor LexA
MIDMGILDNDIVLIRHQMTAENGDVVVAITEKGATLKVLKRGKKKIFLEPRNKDYPIIEVKRLEIRGVLVGLIRAE